MDGNKEAPREQGAGGRRGTKAACVMEVIAVETSIGKGTADDPKRIICEYWSMGGQLLAVYDPEISPF